MMAFTNEDLMNEIKRNLNETKEIKTTVEKSLTLMEDMVRQFSHMKEKCKALEEQNYRLTEEVKVLNRQLRRNNFIIYNVPNAENENVVDKVKEVCADAEININEQNINNCYRMGRGGDPRPILVSLNSNLLKRNIFEKKELFQQKHYRLSHDRTREERDEGKRIYDCINKLRSLDSRVIYARKMFKFRGSYYSLKEAESLLDGCEIGAQSDEEQVKKKQRVDEIKERLGQFRFRPNSPSSSSVKSVSA